MQSQPVLSTTELGRCISYSGRKVLDLIYRGELKAYRTSDGRGSPYRIHVSDALRYTRQAGIPCPYLEEAVGHARTPSVMLITPPDTVRAFAEAGWVAIWVPHPWLFGAYLAGPYACQAVVIDTAGVTTDARAVAGHLRREYPAVTVGLITYDGQRWAEDGCCRWHAPVAVERVARELRAKVEAGR